MTLEAIVAGFVWQRPLVDIVHSGVTSRQETSSGTQEILIVPIPSCVERIVSCVNPDKSRVIRDTVHTVPWLFQ